jgi:hypothetical protein
LEEKEILFWTQFFEISFFFCLNRVNWMNCLKIRSLFVFQMNEFNVFDELQELEEKEILFWTQFFEISFFFLKSVKIWFELFEDSTQLNENIMFQHFIKVGIKKEIIFVESNFFFFFWILNFFFLLNFFFFYRTKKKKKFGVYLFSILIRPFDFKTSIWYRKVL